MPDSLRLVLGTLTRLPVPPPRSIDRRVAAGAMLLAPLVGLLMAGVIGGAVQVLAPRIASATGPLLLSALAIAALAYLTRGLHLDGLADTADALGSGRPADEALAIARKSDIGPFGVVTLVLVLLVQVVAYAGLVADGRAVIGLVIAVGTARLALTLACTRGVPAARADGLGAAMAGSVPAWATILEAAGWLVVCVGLTAWTAPGHPITVALAAIAVLGGLLCAAIVIRIAIRRLGGITGDVLGATVELTAAAALVILVAVPS